MVFTFIILFFSDYKKDISVRLRRHTTSQKSEVQQIDRLQLNFTTEAIVQTVYAKQNETTHVPEDQVVINSTTLDLGIRLCPDNAKPSIGQQQDSFVLYQLTDEGEGIAMDSYQSHHEDILQDSREEQHNIGCYMYWLKFDVTNTIQAWLVEHCLLYTSDAADE